jgi:hypothetical protein
MPTKLFYHVEQENFFSAPTDDFVEVSRLPLEGGQPYLAQAKGIALLFAGASVRLKLELRGFFGEVIHSQESDYINGDQQFVLTAAATLPAEGGAGSEGTPIPPGASANLLIRVFDFPPHPISNLIGIADIVLTALEVDEIVTA